MSIKYYVVDDMFACKVASDYDWEWRYIGPFATTAGSYWTHPNDNGMDMSFDEFMTSESTAATYKEFKEVTKEELFRLCL